MYFCSKLVPCGERICFVLPERTGTNVFEVRQIMLLNLLHKIFTGSREKFKDWGKNRQKLVYPKDNKRGMNFSLKP